MNQNNNLTLESWDKFKVFSESKQTNALEEYKQFKHFSELVRSLPKTELIKRGWIEQGSDPINFIDFYKEITNPQNAVLFRKAKDASDALAGAWLANTRTQAQFEFLSGKIAPFQGLTLEDVKEIAQLSVNVGVVKELPEILANKGIILIYNLFLPGMKLDGAVFKLSSGTPVIGLSLRFPRLDNLWFTLLHELAHIYKHLDKIETPILEDLETDSEDRIEVEANRIAKNSIVSKYLWRNCEVKYKSNKETLEKFANEIGVHKALIAGLLRKESGNYELFSKEVTEVNIRNLIFNND